MDTPTGGGGLEWMAWTPGTAIFVAIVFATLTGLAVLSAFRPPAPRRGFLPIATTVGDRIYVGLLGTGLVLIGLIALTTVPLTVGLGLAVVWMAVVLTKG